MLGKRSSIIMVALTELHKERGYYTLPGVDRPINPRDPLGLWNVYFEERRLSRLQKKDNMATAKNGHTEVDVHADQSHASMASLTISEPNNPVRVTVITLISSKYFLFKSFYYLKGRNVQDF